MATLTATAGQPHTFRLDGAPEGITTWQVRIRDNTGAVVLGPAEDDLDTLTEGLESTEVAPDVVQYSVELTIPAPAEGYEPNDDDLYPYTVRWMTEGQESQPDVLLVTIGAMLVSLSDVRQHLKNQVSGVHDDELRRAIRAATPLIENIVGPVIPRTITEWHDGGASTIQVRRRPSTAPGTSPILTLVACTEYSGSTAYDLAVIDTPAAGTTYSVSIDEIGTICRRTGGGGVGIFAGDRVKVVYIAGQETVPANVYDATLEFVRFNYMTTQPTGSGRLTVSDDLDPSGDRAFAMPSAVRELLAPNRRAPSIA